MRHETFADPFPGIPKPRRASAREIIRQVAWWHGYGRAEIMSRCRRLPIVAARFDAVAAVRIAYPHLSKPAIGRIFGGRDHTTILNALRRRGLS